MDEISKLVFGCVALVGLVVLIIPNSDPLASSKGAQPVAGAAIPPPPNIPSGPAAAPAPIVGESSGGSSSGFAVEDYNLSKFGDPMIDPTPQGQRSTNGPANGYQNQGVPPPPNIGQGESMPPPGQGIPPGAPGIPIAPPPMVQPN
jgi:hypothetical protein